MRLFNQIYGQVDSILNSEEAKSLKRKTQCFNCSYYGNPFEFDWYCKDLGRLKGHTLLKV